MPPPHTWLSDLGSPPPLRVPGHQQACRTLELQLTRPRFTDWESQACGVLGCRSRFLLSSLPELKGPELNVAPLSSLLPQAGTLQLSPPLVVPSGPSPWMPLHRAPPGPHCVPGSAPSSSPRGTHPAHSWGGGQLHTITASYQSFLPSSFLRRVGPSEAGSSPALEVFELSLVSMPGMVKGTSWHGS